MCTPLLPKMHTPRPFVKRCYGRKCKKLCGNRFRSTAEPYIVKKYRKSLANQGLCKKKLNTNQDTHCIKIGVQLWLRRQDLNLRINSLDQVVFCGVCIFVCIYTLEKCVNLSICLFSFLVKDVSVSLFIDAFRLPSPSFHCHIVRHA